MSTHIEYGGAADIATELVTDDDTLATMFDVDRREVVWSIGLASDTIFAVYGTREQIKKFLDRLVTSVHQDLHELNS